MKMHILRISRALGLFRVTRWLFRKRLLILCYHGFELDDEAAFRPGVFMRRATFGRRIDKLVKDRYNVLPLTEAVSRLENGSLPPNSVVLTLDDGFYSVLTEAHPVLGKAGLPSTLYSTTYYSSKAAPVFRLVIQYMFWKTTRDTVEFPNSAWRVHGRFRLAQGDTAHRLCWALIDQGEHDRDEPGRQAMCRELGEALGVDYERIVNSRMLSLLSPEELSRLDRSGMDVQLHTHRHGLSPDTSSKVRTEIADNACYLDRWLDKRCSHFCYPSGEWQRSHLVELRAIGIESATTCDRGMNDGATDTLALYRMLDGEDVSDLEFDAELSGFSELLRIFSGKKRRSDRARPAYSRRIAAATSTEARHG